MSIRVADLLAQVTAEPVPDVRDPDLVPVERTPEQLAALGPFCLVCDGFPALLTGPRQGSGHVGTRFGDHDANWYTVYLDDDKQRLAFEAMAGESLGTPGWVFRLALGEYGQGFPCDRGHFSPVAPPAQAECPFRIDDFGSRPPLFEVAVGSVRIEGGPPTDEGQED